MGKVKGEEKFPNEVAQNNRRRKKRRKELDLLRRNVLENKRKLDNKTQGFDSRGRRSGRKKICNRLLPSRKPQVGIFANGAKGAEIKRVNLSLNELDKARFEGDLQKVLDNGKRKCRESRSDVLEEILHKPSPGTMDLETQEFIEIQENTLDDKPKQNFVAARQSCKRKMQVPIELEERTTKRPHSQMEDTKVPVEHTKVKSKLENLTDKKWKRSLFHDEVDDFEPICELGVEQLRFSPIIGQARDQVHPSETKLFREVALEPQNTKKQNFNYERFGRKVATKYKELCAMVRAENFDTCLQEIPHIDPLTKVKQSLMNFYGETCKQKALRKHIKPEVIFAEESANCNLYQTPLNIHRNKYSADEDVNLVRSKSDTVNVSPPREVCLANLKKFSHRKEATETSSTQSKPPITKAREVERSKNIPCVTRGDGPPSPEASITEPNARSLDVNYDSSSRSFDSDVLEFFEIDEDIGESVVDLDKISNSRLAGIPSNRKQTVLRYLKEVNNSKQLNKEGPIRPAELFAISAENNAVQKCYLGDPSSGRELRRKQGQNRPENKLDEIRGAPTSAAMIPQHSLDVNFDSAGSCLGFDPSEFPKTDGRVEPKVVNLGSASSSTLSRIPSDRGQILLKFLQGVENPEPGKENGVTFLPEVLAGGPEYYRNQKDDLCDSSTDNQMKNTSVEPPIRNERHVPAILRKSQATRRNKKSKIVGNWFAKGALGIDNLGIDNSKWKSSNFNFQKLSSENEATPVDSLFNKVQIPRKPPSTVNPFRTDPKNSISYECLDFVKKMSQASELEDREPPVGTPPIVNAFYNMNNKGLGKERRYFLDDRFANESSAVGQQNVVLGPSGAVNFSAGFKLQSPTIFRRKNTVEEVTLSNFRNGHPKSGDSPIFLHQHQRPDVRARRAPCEEKEIEFQGDQESRRFPVFLKRKNTSSTKKRARREGQHQARPSPEKSKPKVVVIQKPKLRGYSEDVKQEMNMPLNLYKNNVQTQRPNAVGQTFSKFPRGVQMTSINQGQPQNGRRKIQGFQTDDDSRQIVGRQVEQVGNPRCACKTTYQQNVQQIQLPRNMYQNGMRKVLNRKYTAQELGNKYAMNFFEQKTCDIPATSAGRIFRHDSSSDADVPGTCISSYCGNTNSEDQRNGNSAERIQLFDTRVGFATAETELKSFYQSSNNLPLISDQMPHTQNYKPVLSEDKNRNYRYIIDPRCPQAGYKRNQIDQNGAEILQRVIQPAYNANDAYRPQIPQSFFSPDS